MFFTMNSAGFPSFSNYCVSVVICACAKAKMLWVDAGRIITRMKNKHSLWNNAFVKRKGVSMGLYMLNSVPKPTISICFASGPYPTVSRFINLFPKSLFRRFVHLSIIALITTACGTSPTVLTETEVVYQDKIVRQEVPADLLTKCRVASLPRIGSGWTWFEIYELMKQKDSEQKTCNDRFDIIKEWQEQDYD